MNFTAKPCQGTGRACSSGELRDPPAHPELQAASTESSTTPDGPGHHPHSSSPRGHMPQAARGRLAGCSTNGRTRIWRSCTTQKQCSPEGTCSSGRKGATGSCILTAAPKSWLKVHFTACPCCGARSRLS